MTGTLGTGQSSGTFSPAVTGAPGIQRQTVQEHSHLLEILFDRSDTRKILISWVFMKGHSLGTSHLLGIYFDRLESKDILTMLVWNPVTG